MNITDLVIPPWVKVAVPLALVAAVLGGGYFLKSSRDHWKQVANDRQTSINHLDQQIRDMTTAQDNQLKVTTKTVEKVVTVPGPTKTILKVLHDAPTPPNCGTPDYPYVRQQI